MKTTHAPIKASVKTSRPSWRSVARTTGFIAGGAVAPWLIAGPWAAAFYVMGALVATCLPRLTSTTVTTIETSTTTRAP